MTVKYTLETHGFEEIEASEGMTNAAAFTKDCKRINSVEHPASQPHGLEH